MKIGNLKFTLPWIIYISLVIFYTLFNVMEYPFFGVEKKAITNICLTLLSISIFWSLSNITNSKQSLAYIFYWIAFGIFVEYVAIATGRYAHDESLPTILGIVPATIFFNWLIIIFAVYSLSTFTAFQLKKHSKKWLRLIQVAFLDGFFLLLYALMYEPIGNYLGYFSWDISSTQFVVWDMIPLRTFFEYLFGFPFFMLPIRWWEIYKSPTKTEAYTRKISYPLYFGWSLFAAFTYWAFLKGIANVGNFGLILLLLLSILIFIGRKRLKSI